MAKSTVYFTNELTPEAVVKMYRQLGIELPGKDEDYLRERMLTMYANPARNQAAALQ